MSHPLTEAELNELQRRRAIEAEPLSEDEIQLLGLDFNEIKLSEIDVNYRAGCRARLRRQLPPPPPPSPLRAYSTVEMDWRIQRLIKATATFARGLVAPLKDELAKLTARVETLEAPETAAPGDERRQVDLEARLVSLERRVANHDARLDANRKHVEGLERKFGNMVHGK